MCGAIVKPRIVLYCDEVSPGNQLRHEATRKVQILYWGIKCAPGMSVDQLWFTLGLARSSIVNKLVGGMSGYVKKALQLFFSPINMHMGVQLRVGDEVHIKFAKLAMFLADEVALKEVFNFRGASGILFCPLCLNLVSESSNLHRYGDRSLVPSTSCEKTKWVRAGDNTILAKLRKLHQAHGTVSKATFEDLEKKLGWSYNPFGILGDGSASPEHGIKVEGMLQFDYMHTLLVHGLWNIEVGALVDLLKRQCKIQQSEIHSFFAGFCWPASSASRSVTGQNIFRKKQEDVVKCSASEGLGAYMVVRAFLALNQASFPNSVASAVESYMALARVLDVLLALRKECTAPIIANLDSSITAFVKSHQQAWGSSLWVPKHHYLMHLPEMYATHKVVAGCFVHERKHRVAKRFSENMRRVSDDFEASILKEVLHVNLTDLEDKEIDQLHVGLVKPVPADGSLKLHLQQLLGTQGSIYRAREAHYCVGGSSTAGNFVLLDLDGRLQVGEVLFFAASDDTSFVCANLWNAQGGNVFVKTERHAICDLSCIRECLIYKKNSALSIYVAPNTMWV